jgi:predicted short-subunit dehydrogenase-like oxidoreductase (DUF2520 family)
MEQRSGHPEHLPAVLRGKRVVILGTGRVGSAVGALLRRSGSPVAAVTTRSALTAGQAAVLTGGEPCTDNAAASARGDVVLITTNDDAIARVVVEVASAGAFRAGQLVVHMSGALGLSVLEPAAEAGAVIGCAHPLQAFATAEHALRGIPGSVFGVTAGPGALETLEALVQALGGHAVSVRDEQKPLYHAAAVVASNYLVAIADLATALLTDAGFDEATAAQALEPLVRGTADNIFALGTTDALTGPIVRGDVDTVRKHLAALAGSSDERLRLYKTLGRRTLDIARRRGTLDAQAEEALRAVLDDAAE